LPDETSNQTFDETPNETPDEMSDETSNKTPDETNISERKNKSQYLLFFFISKYFVFFNF